jgi:hypothetical protein
MAFSFNCFHPLARKPNLDKFSIYSNKFFHIFHLSESSFTCPGLRASGLTRRLQLKCRSSIRVPTEFWNWGYNCCFFLNFVPLHIESPYNFGGTGPILGVKNPLQRVNGHAEYSLVTLCIFITHTHTHTHTYIHTYIRSYLG